jgi:hypothetical protein
MPDARKFLAKPNNAFIHVAILDIDKCGSWKWPETSCDGGWAPWTAFSSYLPIYENTDKVKPWQWPLPKG